MTYHGKVRDGVIVLDPPVNLPEGSEVEVSPLPANAEASIPGGADGPTLAEIFKDWIGKAEGMPSDSSLNHDHYLYGVPKK